MTTKPVAEQVEYRTLGVDDIAGKYASPLLSRVLVGCNTGEVRAVALKHFNTWCDTKINDLPYLWAILAAMNNNPKLAFFEGTSKLKDSGFPCVFFNYDCCEKPDHAAKFHFCMFCREVHPLVDWDLGGKPTGKCPMWTQLSKDFGVLCEKLQAPAAEVEKLFRLTPTAAANPTIQVVKRSKLKKRRNCRSSSSTACSCCPAACGCACAFATTASSRRESTTRCASSPCAGSTRRPDLTTRHADADDWWLWCRGSRVGSKDYRAKRGCSARVARIAGPR